MIIDILTIFPSMFEGFLSNSIIKRAIDKKVVEVNVIDIRPFSDDKNKRVDDYPIGGGAGMIMKCQPVLDCLKSIKKENSKVFIAASTHKGEDEIAFRAFENLRNKNKTRCPDSQIQI